MVFVSDKEINCKNNDMLTAFTGVNSVDKFKALDLPTVNYTDLDPFDNSSPTTLAYEIDLKYYKSIVKKMKVYPKKVDCYPLLWF